MCACGESAPGKKCLFLPVRDTHGIIWATLQLGCPPSHVVLLPASPRLAPPPFRAPLGRSRFPTPPHSCLRLRGRPPHRPARSRTRTPRPAALGAVMAARSSFSGHRDIRASRGGASSGSSNLTTAGSLSRGVHSARAAVFAKAERRGRVGQEAMEFCAAADSRGAD